jgi:glycerophosphoryl diester phosphodiesterase
MSYAEMITPTGLAHVAGYADAIGPDLRMLVGADGNPTGLVEAAHAAGLKVHGWTVRKENAFLPPPLRRGSDEGATGNYAGAWRLMAATGADALFTDDPALAVEVRRSASR